MWIGRNVSGILVKFEKFYFLMEYEILCEGEIIARDFDRFYFMIFMIILIQILISSSVLPQERLVA